MGDSGGPLLAGGKVVGVLDGGYSPAGKVSEYGDRSIWATFLDPANQSFLLGAGLAVPEPTVALLLSIAGLGFLLRRSR